ncbi:uncharacterized protein DMAD_07697 [Drosophila madeirensis]|uniref:Uncharacterized protein n=1 Tax=Drosophila madeirensis TaxID=30013 RepID=A0AAU9EYK7_DROMD
MVKVLRVEGSVRDVRTRVRLADGSTKEVTQAVIVEVRLDQQVTQVSLLVLPVVADDVILGLDFLCGIQAVLQCGRPYLQLTRDLNSIPPSPPSRIRTVTFRDEPPSTAPLASTPLSNPTTKSSPRYDLVKANSPQRTTHSLRYEHAKPSKAPLTTPSDHEQADLSRTTWTTQKDIDHAGPSAKRTRTEETETPLDTPRTSSSTRRHHQDDDRKHGDSGQYSGSSIRTTYPSLDHTGPSSTTRTTHRSPDRTRPSNLTRTTQPILPHTGHRSDDATTYPRSDDGLPRCSNGAEDLPSRKPPAGEPSLAPWVTDFLRRELAKFEGLSNVSHITQQNWRTTSP